MATATENMTAGDIMHKGCTCIAESKSVLDAARVMDQEGIGALPVCGSDDKLKGMLTDRDIVVKCLAQGKDPASTTAGELCGDTLIWTSEDSNVRDVLSMMQEHKIRRVPVIGSDKRLVGIISQGDIATELSDQLTGELVGEISTGPSAQHPV